MKGRLVKIAAVALALVFIADIALAYLADRRIRKADYHFQQRLAGAGLDFEGDWMQSCELGRVFAIYVYKTCFVLNNSFAEPDRWVFRFVYAGPRPVLLGGGRRDSYRFNMMSAAPTIRRIHFDGTITGEDKNK